MSKRKLFIFHNKKAIAHIEQQPNQSRYIENLVIEDLKPKQETDILNLFQKYLSSIQTSSIQTSTLSSAQIEIEPNESNKLDNNISNSISNILNST